MPSWTLSAPSKFDPAQILEARVVFVDSRRLLVVGTATVCVATLCVLANIAVEDEEN